jgi:hypothetical protein
MKEGEFQALERKETLETNGGKERRASGLERGREVTRSYHFPGDLANHGGSNGHNYG